MCIAKSQYYYRFVLVPLQLQIWKRIWGGQLKRRDKNDWQACFTFVLHDLHPINARGQEGFDSSNQNVLMIMSVWSGLDYFQIPMLFAFHFLLELQWSFLILL